MSRRYGRKDPNNYSDDSLQLALLAEEKGQLIYAAVKAFEIPYQALRRWVTKSAGIRVQENNHG